MCRPSTRRCAEGFSLVELMVAMTLMLVIGGGVLSLSLSSRRIYERDEARTRLNQGLRAGMDFLGADIRQAGERLPADFPAIGIVDGGGGAPDQLSLRRNLLDVVLPVCVDLAAGATQIEIAVAAAPPPGCAPLPDDDADGWPDNLGTWRAERLARGGAARAYIYDPVNGTGEFLTYDAENAPGLWIRAASGLGAAYAAADDCRLYLLEERRYSLAGDLLQLEVDRGQPMHVVDRLLDFQAVAVFQDGTRQDTLGPADVWADLRGIEISLRGDAEVRGATFSRSVSAEFFPRNVLSR